MDPEHSDPSISEVLLPSVVAAEPILKSVPAGMGSVMVMRAADALPELVKDDKVDEVLSASAYSNGESHAP